MKWGIFDTVDQVWVGSNPKGDGPKLYEEHERDLAKVAARMADAMFKTEPGRHREKEFVPQPVRLRDRKKTKLTAVEALEGLESGRIL
jgi:hypothetical protein